MSVGDEPTPQTRKLLLLMAAGATDRTIARELGVSERTICRRIARLELKLGVRTRFQLGVLAASRDWL
ncbi:response regulator transcription factor [Saccharothrix saharensis]|uniref:response regulator transcription factor n=1 Tax=Saccharothrix saharensis TaxID=571190 RepID=UPI00369AA629